MTNQNEQLSAIEELLDTELQVQPLTTNRAKHSLAVANKMLKMAQKERPEDKIFHIDMWLLGYLHDIGYSINSNNHAEAAADYLDANDYPYADEIRYHSTGIIPPSIQSTALNFLQTADMTTSPTGEDITPEQRLADIKHRYGEDSKAYQESKLIITRLFNPDSP